MSDLLPPNATAPERAISNAIDRDVATPIRAVWDADNCPASVLAWLAWAFSVDEWDSTWTDAQKRAYIKRSIEVQKYKGTIGAVRDALASLGVQARVQEWFNQIPEGNPYTFKVLLTADQIGIGQQAINSLFAVIERTKNLRSHMGNVEITAKTLAGPTVAAVAGLGSDIRVTNYVWATAVFNETTICM